MSLDQRWTLSSMEDACYRELLDPNHQWWLEPEIHNYIDNWAQELQSNFEFSWGTATISTALSTVTLSNVATDIMRLDAIYCCPGTGTWGIDTNTYRLSPRDVIDLDEIARDWRSQGTLLLPTSSYQNDAYTVSFWPVPPGTCTFIFEYPRSTAFAAPGSQMQAPAWCRYGVIPYVAYKALSRFGPNQDLQKAARYRKRHDANLRRYRKIYDAYLPEHAPVLRPGRKWSSEIVNPRQNNQRLP